LVLLRLLPHISGLLDIKIVLAILIFAPCAQCASFKAKHSPLSPLNDSDPRVRCAKCHSEIVSKYSKTDMAHASGPASEDPIQGRFLHKSSGVEYRVQEEGGKLWLDFSRSGERKLSGRREFLYYIGSGKLKGRTYLFNLDGFLFESPINWYAQQRLWDMTPNYQNVSEAPLNLPAFPECLNCHTSGMHPPAASTANLYPEAPFLHGGITCERCHGSSLDHAQNGTPMLVLSRLPANRRDAICMQCHLEGDAAVERPGKHAYEFRPGDDLSQFVRYFVFANKTNERAVSQFEALAQSHCKLSAGDKMTCTTCHDPHSQPEPAQAAAYFRQKCMQCHGDGFAQKHHPENPNCVGCHMPSVSTTDITHTEVTDHRILRRTAQKPETLVSQSNDLEPFPATTETKDDWRDLGLAYESLVEHGNSELSGKAEKMLHSAREQNPSDAPVLTALGYIAQRRGDLEKSRAYYEQALRSDADEQDAAANLAVIEAGEGRLRDAVSLWQKVFQRAPWRSQIGINIALGYCAAKQYQHAAAYVNRVLEFNPDYGVGRSLHEQLSADPPSCSLRR